MNDADKYIQTQLTSSRGAVRIEPGVYQISQPVVIPRFAGDVDMRGVVIEASAQFSHDSLVEITGTKTERSESCRLHGLTVKGRRREICGIRSCYSRNLEIENVRVQNCKGAGIEIINAWDLLMYRVTVMECGTESIAAVYLIGDGGPDGSATATTFMLRVERFTGTAIRCDRQKSMEMIATKIHGVMDGSSKLGIDFTDCDGVFLNGGRFTLVRSLWDSVRSKIQAIGITDRTRNTL